MLKMNKQEKLKTDIINCINSSDLNRKYINKVLNELHDIYNKAHDKPVLTDRLKELANEALDIDNTITALPLGYWYADYAKWCFTCDFDDVFDIFDSNRDKIHYRFLEFHDDMTKGDWKKMVSIMRDIISESKIYDGWEDGDMCHKPHITPLIYDVKTQSFVELPELD